MAHGKNEETAMGRGKNLGPGPKGRAVLGAYSEGGGETVLEAGPVPSYIGKGRGQG